MLALSKALLGVVPAVPMMRWIAISWQWKWNGATKESHHRQPQRQQQ